MRMFYKYLWIIFILILVGTGIYFSYKYVQSHRSRLSPDQQRFELNLGNGIINFKDPKTNLEQDLDFNNKKASISIASGNVNYEITDILQPFNIDAQGAREWPFLLEASYPDGAKIDYLTIAREDGNKYKVIDMVSLGNANQIDDLHSLNDREVIVDAFWGEGDNKERAQLSYTFSNDKIIPGANNIDISKSKPKPILPPAPTPDKKTADNPASSGSKGKVALTFDDGPGKYTPQILAILKDKGVKATFFEIGQNAESHSDYTKAVHDDGHLIGNHTYTHPQLSKLSYDAQMDEITHTNNIINGIIGLSPHYFRPPYGSYNSDTLNVLSKLGMEKVLWNVDPRDWSGVPASDILNTVLSTTKSGSIVLMHDGVANSVETAKALPDIIDGLRSRGYTLVKLSDL